MGSMRPLNLKDRQTETGTVNSDSNGGRDRDQVQGQEPGAGSERISTSGPTLSLIPSPILSLAPEPVPV